MEGCGGMKKMRQGEEVLFMYGRRWAFAECVIIVFFIKKSACSITVSNTTCYFILHFCC